MRLDERITDEDQVAGPGPRLRRHRLAVEETEAVRALPGPIIAIVCGCDFSVWSEMLANLGIEYGRPFGTKRGGACHQCGGARTEVDLANKGNHKNEYDGNAQAGCDVIPDPPTRSPYSQRLANEIHVISS